MTEFNKVFDHIKYNRLPLQYKIDNNIVSIDCRGWDIKEIDDMIMVVGGTRDGFTVNIEVDNEPVNSISN